MHKQEKIIFDSYHDEYKLHSGNNIFKKSTVLSKKSKVTADLDVYGNILIDIYGKNINGDGNW